MFAIDFEWWRDDAGYDYVPAAPGKPKPSEMSALYQIIGPLIQSDGRAARIVRRGGKLVPYRPFEKDGGRLYQIFASLGSTAKQLLDFVNRFGPLTEDGNRECGEEVLFAFSAAGAMREVLSRPLKERGAYFARYGDKGLRWSRIDVSLVSNPITSKPQFRLTPPTLINAIWIQLGQALSSDASIRNCLHCGEWFEAGPGARRREDAKFCSDAHRVAFHSRKRSQPTDPVEKYLAERPGQYRAAEQEWIRKNRRYVTDPDFHYRVVKAHGEAVDQLGLERGTPEYFAHLEKRGYMRPDPRQQQTQPSANAADDNGVEIA